MKTNVAARTDAIVTALGTDGWVVVPGFLSGRAALALARESGEAWETGAFRLARVGRGSDLQLREDLRTDHVLWLEPGQLTAAQEKYLALLEELRLAINAALFLGLFDFEGHFAIYPKGAFYRAHLDRHRQTGDRLVTVILYLNECWQPGHGGELKIRTTPGARNGPFKLVEPRLGTLVCFLAGEHWHEVLPATRPRLSITGWFRSRSS